jgi:hypothetical protein
VVDADLPAFGPPTDIVDTIRLSPANPNILAFGYNVELTMPYTTNASGGVRIFARPFTGGSLTPGYAASPSPLYQVRKGVASGYFTITDGTVTVDQVRIQMWDANQTKLLFRVFVPVSYQFN